MRKRKYIYLISVLAIFSATIQGSLFPDPDKFGFKNQTSFADKYYENEKKTVKLWNGIKEKRNAMLSAAGTIENKTLRAMLGVYAEYFGFDINIYTMVSEYYQRATDSLAGRIKKAIKKDFWESIRTPKWREYLYKIKDKPYYEDATQLVSKMLIAESNISRWQLIQYVRRLNLEMRNQTEETLIIHLLPVEKEKRLKMINLMMSSNLNFFDRIKDKAEICFEIDDMSTPIGTRFDRLIAEDSKYLRWWYQTPWICSSVKTKITWMRNELLRMKERIHAIRMNGHESLNWLMQSAFWELEKCRKIKEWAKSVPSGSDNLLDYVDTKLYGNEAIEKIVERIPVVFNNILKNYEYLMKQIEDIRARYVDDKKNKKNKKNDTENDPCPERLRSQKIQAASFRNQFIKKYYVWYNDPEIMWARFLSARIEGLSCVIDLADLLSLDCVFPYKTQFEYYTWERDGGNGHRFDIDYTTDNKCKVRFRLSDRDGDPPYYGYTVWFRYDRKKSTMIVERIADSSNKPVQLQSFNTNIDTWSKQFYHSLKDKMLFY